jgi:hypothetical protein
MRRRGFLGALAAATATLATPIPDLGVCGEGYDIVVPAPQVSGLKINLVEASRRIVYAPRELVCHVPDVLSPGSKIECDPVEWEVDKQRTFTGVRVWGGEVCGQRWVKYAPFYQSVSPIDGDKMIVTYSITVG